MTSLPTRLKIDIRDNWTKEESTLQKAQKVLADLIGYQIHSEPEWHMLWAELQPNFPDMSTFIPSISSIVTAWCNALTTILDDDKNSEWTEQLLEELSNTNTLKIRLEVSGKDRPTTRWTADKNAFTIFLPKASPSSTSTMVGGFSSDFLSCFQPEPAQPVPLATSHTLPDDSWADIEVDSASGKVDTREEKLSASSAALMNEAIIDIIPDINTLERPEYLMLKPPYHLSISHSTYQKEMVVQCSHPPSLKVIEGYLKRWTKRDNNTVNRPPAVVITLQESPFGLGLVFDRLHISMQNSRMNYMLSPTMLLSFVEGVLRYKLTFGNGDTWTFRKETEFKS